MMSLGKSRETRLCSQRKTMQCQHLPSGIWGQSKNNNAGALQMNVGQTIAMICSGGGGKELLAKHTTLANHTTVCFFFKQIRLKTVTIILLTKHCYLRY